MQSASTEYQKKLTISRKVLNSYTGQQTFSRVLALGKRVAFITYLMAAQKKGQKQKNNLKKKPRTYTVKELNVPVLNTVAMPAAVQKKRKKGKVFVEDQASLLGILAEVNEAKEGQIRSKLERIKDLEEVRERKRIEMEHKERSKAALMEKRKADLRGGEGTKSNKHADKTSATEGPQKFYGDYRGKQKKKSVAFDG